jgi:hypothetical protein
MADCMLCRTQQALCAWTWQPPCMVSDHTTRPCSVLWCGMLLADLPANCCACHMHCKHDIRLLQQQPASRPLIFCRHVSGTITAREAEDMCDFLNEGGTATDAYLDYGTKTKPYHMRVSSTKHQLPCSLRERTCLLAESETEHGKGRCRQFTCQVS